MKINWLEYKNKHTGLTIKRISFNGSSILTSEHQEAMSELIRVIKETRGFALGSHKTNFAGAILRINFSIEEKEYMWFLKLVEQDHLILNHDNPLSYSGVPRIFEEELYNQDSELIFQRVYENARVKGIEQLPQLNSIHSLLFLFNNDEELKPIVDGFTKLFIISTHEDCCFEMDSEKYHTFLHRCQQDNMIPYQPVVTPLKLGLLEKLNGDKYNQVKSAFTTLYPEFSDLKIGTLFDDQLYSIYIKQEETWLNCLQINGDQFSTLNLLINLYTVPDHSVVVINDSNANINLPAVLKMMSQERPSLQLILSTQQHISDFGETITLIKKEQVISNSR